MEAREKKETWPDFRSLGLRGGDLLVSDTGAHEGTQVLLLGLKWGRRKLASQT